MQLAVQHYLRNFLECRDKQFPWVSFFGRNHLWGVGCGAIFLGFPLLLITPFSGLFMLIPFVGGALLGGIGGQLRNNQYLAVDMVLGFLSLFSFQELDSVEESWEQFSAKSGQKTRRGYVTIGDSAQEVF